MEDIAISRFALDKRLIAGLALIIAAGVVVAIVLFSQSPSSSAAASGSPASSGSGTASVERRNLVQTDTESGTLAYADPHTVYNRLSGTITWLPSIGQLIRPGQPLFRIDNNPVILLNGSTPEFRTLSSGDSPGPDILELNQNLIALGFNPYGIVANDTWQAATTAGVEQFQGSLGETQTGTLTLGQVVFLPGPQLVSTVSASVGSTGGGGGGGGGAGSGASNPAAASLLDPVAHTDFVSLTTPTAGSPRSPGATPTPTSSSRPPRRTGSGPTTGQGSGPTTPHGSSPGGSPTRRGGGPPPVNSGGSAGTSAELQAALAALRAALQALHSQPRAGASSPRPSASSSTPGSSAGSASASSPATAIMQTTSDRLVVTVQLPATSQSEAVVGSRVTVELPNSSTVGGRITAVSRVAQNSSSGSGSGSGAGGGGNGGAGNGGSTPTIPVTIALTGHVGGQGLDQAAVSVNFAQARASHVLSVPVTALIATPGNNYAVQEAAAPHRLIPVTTGLFAAGYVQVSGAGIYPGLAVTDSQG